MCETGIDIIISPSNPKVFVLIEFRNGGHCSRALWLEHNSILHQQPAVFCCILLFGLIAVAHSLGTRVRVFTAVLSIIAY